MADQLNTETIVIKWLNALALDGWTAYGEMPSNMPDQFLLVERVGGGRESMVLDQAEILIEVYHKKSKNIASDTANLIGDKIPLLLEKESVTHASVNSIIPVDDTRNQYRRYHVYADISNRR